MTRSVGDLAFLSDCRTAAMVTFAGAVEWWPGPRFDGPSAFSRLLDPDGGHFTIRPVTDDVQTTRSYVPGTLVLRTEHQTPTGTLAVIDCLALAPDARGHDIGLDHPHALLRLLEVLDGELEVDVRFEPRLEYGLVMPRLIRDEGFVQTIGGAERLYLTGAEELEVADAHAEGRIRMSAGQRRGFVVQRVAGPHGSPPTPLDAETWVASTIEAWRSWTDAHVHFDGPYADEVHLARLVLQGLTYQPTGAVVAAATTSLPEVIRGSANWDYRYAWLRDSSLVTRALLRVTCADEAVRYFAWIVRAAVSCRDDSHIQVVFGVSGERNLEEVRLGHLRGFADSRPVRIGNAAWRQRQLDAPGEVLDVALALGDDLKLDPVTEGVICRIADRAAEDWRKPDTGVWEERQCERHHTVSKMMCWVALDRAVKLAPRLGAAGRVREWTSARNDIHDAVLTQAWNEDRRAFVGELGGDALDAAVLLAPIVGFIDAGDPRMRSTVGALRSALECNGLLRRHELIAEDGAFLPATFWLASCEAMAGDLSAARAAFERAASCSNDLGLLAEMAHATTWEGMGNMPQALSHVALITAAVEIHKAQTTMSRIRLKSRRASLPAEEPEPA